MKPALTRIVTAPTGLAVLALVSLVALGPGCESSHRPATWSYISPVIFQPSCASGSCHSPGAAAAGLDFSTPDRGYTSLTGLWVWIVDPTKAGSPGCGMAAGTTVCERMYRPLVTPYDPSQSRLINLLRGRDARRMPPDRPLDEADIELVEDWILNGARKNENEPDSGATVDAGVSDAAIDLASDANDTGDGGDAADAGARDASLEGAGD